MTVSEVKLVEAEYFTVFQSTESVLQAIAKQLGNEQKKALFVERLHDDEEKGLMTMIVFGEASEVILACKVPLQTEDEWLNLFREKWEYVVNCGLSCWTYGVK